MVGEKACKKDLPFLKKIIFMPWNRFKYNWQIERNKLCNFNSRKRSSQTFFNNLTPNNNFDYIYYKKKFKTALSNFIKGNLYYHDHNDNRE
mgnify:CR=1 FL=1